MSPALPRKFCRFCGCVIRGDMGACRTHKHLLAEDYRYMRDTYLDELRGAGVESQPMQAAEHREATPPDKATED